MTVLLLGGNTPSHLPLNSEVMVKSSQDELHVFEIYTPITGWIMFEGFECRGEVNIIGSEDYEAVLSRKPEIKFTHTKTAGHYVGRAKVQPGLYFMGVEPRHSQAEENLAIVKYSMFADKEFPYDKFEIEDDGNIRFKHTEEGIDFIVKKVDQHGSDFTVLNHYYRVYISDDEDALR